ncbi:hypothetical protein [Streptomyces sp. NPDC046862]|uniref:hypothetical protein n=1 Tax=Streptomyces sp. NPDC046862 TaxID=3154603 RepID=UPI0034572705
MHVPMSLLAGEPLDSAPTVADLTARAAPDVPALQALVRWLYRRRRALPEMPWARAGLSLGLPRGGA